MMHSPFLSSLLTLVAFAAALPSKGPHLHCKRDKNRYSLREVGARNTVEWRIWLEKDCQPISPWHDVPLYPDESNKQIINAVVEIPRWVDGKIEIQREEPLNPIFHDEDDDQPRFVESIWPLKSYPFLYGSIPQTWESPNFNHTFTGFPGDNDPMDFFDIGQNPGYTGQVKQVKILGGLALNDGGETDWKVLVIDLEDPIAELVDNFEDVAEYRPGMIRELYEWFTYYKVPRGDGVLEIIGNAYQNASFIMNEVVYESHGYWRDLVAGEVDTNEINYNQTTKKSLMSYTSSKEAAEKFNLPKHSKIIPPAKKPDDYDQWYFLDKEYKFIEPSS